MMKHFLSRHLEFKGYYRLISCFLGALLTIILINPSQVVVSAPSSEIRGVWLTANDTETLLDQSKLQEAVNQLSRLNFNTLYPVVWNSGYVLYPSAIAKREKIQPFVQKGNQGQDPLQDLITKAHQKGLLVLPWFEFGFMAPPTSEFALKHPSWLTQKRDGSKTTISAAGEVVWMNPFRTEVQNFLLSLVTEVMTLYDVDGIQFDDHLCLPRELGYDNYTLNLYKQETKKDAPADFQDPDWMRWRAYKITEFVTRLKATVKAKKGNAILSISPSPYYTAYRLFLQDWIDWVRKDLVDEIIVQIYRHDLPSFVEQLSTPEIQESRQKVPTGVGILTGLRTRPVAIDFIKDKILAAREKGFGVAFFYFDSLWNRSAEPLDYRQAQLLNVFPTAVVRQLPALPKPTETAVDSSPVKVPPLRPDQAEVTSPIKPEETLLENPLENLSDDPSFRPYESEIKPAIKPDDNLFETSPETPSFRPYESEIKPAVKPTPTENALEVAPFRPYEPHVESESNPPKNPAENLSEDPSFRPYESEINPEVQPQENSNNDGISIPVIIDY